MSTELLPEPEAFASKKQIEHIDMLITTCESNTPNYNVLPKSAPIDTPLRDEAPAFALTYLPLIDSDKTPNYNLVSQSWDDMQLPAPTEDICVIKTMFDFQRCVPPRVPHDIWHVSYAILHGEPDISGSPQAYLTRTVARNNSSAVTSPAEPTTSNKMTADDLGYMHTNELVSSVEADNIIGYLSGVVAAREAQLSDIVPKNFY
jgi:hypothetical protein